MRAWSNEMWSHDVQAGTHRRDDGVRIRVHTTSNKVSMVAYEATTASIKVTVRPVYLDAQSDILAGRFVFGYFVRIENHGDEEVQLLRRHWIITDAAGKVEEVEGEGVIGLQPVIAPGAEHTYSSYSVLATFEGTMEGTYLMQRPNGERFRVSIPLFHLAAAVN